MVMVMVRLLLGTPRRKPHGKAAKVRHHEQAQPTHDRRRGGSPQQPPRLPQRLQLSRRQGRACRRRGREARARREARRVVGDEEVANTRVSHSGEAAQNGKPKVVVMGIAQHDGLQDTLAMLKLLS
jgi:hypothetical protein